MTAETTEMRMDDNFKEGSKIIIIRQEVLTMTVLTKEANANSRIRLLPHLGQMLEQCL
jgi:hypothetical protein